ncbi:MAG: hypothetical protein ACLP1X_09075 [Polyangiaceae bacterium]
MFAFASRVAHGARLALLCWAAAGVAACHGSSNPEPEGSAARPTTAPLPKSATTRNLRGVWGSSDHDIWAVGDGGTIVHFDGQAWSPSKSGTLENLTGVHGVAPNAVWASGEKGAVLQWNGSSWVQASEAKGLTLLGIWASGPSDVWAAGMDGEGDAGMVYRWDGTKWSAQGIPGATSIWAISGSGPHDVWMVGTSQRGPGLVLHGNGSKFDAVGYDGPGVRGVWGSRPDDVWVAPYEGAIQHWNGTAWSKSAMPGPTTPLLHLGGSGPDDVWAVGLGGGMLRYHAGAWSAASTGTSQVLWGVWSRAPDDAWAVGNGGTILHWTGSAWTR